MAELLLPRVMAIAKRHPDRICTVRAGAAFTYGELGGMIGRVAGILEPIIEPGDRVAVLLDNAPEYLAACYGTWAAGGALVGLNTLLRAEELAGRIHHCGARCLLVDSRHRDVGRISELLGDDVIVVEVDGADPFPIEAGKGSTEPAMDSPGAPEPNALASIIYTSGTTGQPKGVMLSHANLAANTDSICGYLPIKEDDRALCVLPFPYSYGASVLHTHLATGATLILEDSLLYPHQILKRIQDEKVTSFAGVPSTFYLFLHRTNLADYDLSSLNYVTQAGARMDPDQIRRFQAFVPKARFFVMYGQTEATARLAYVPPELLDEKPGSAGRPIPGVSFRILGEDGAELPPGQAGEVCARGDNVMMGYWDDALASGEALRDGWLHTGDVGVLDEDGFLFLQGRHREMIKSGAHRIAPVEIEEVIRKVPGVEDVAVGAMDDELLGEAVVAWVIADEPSDGLQRTIQRACQQELARFKVPKAVRFRDAFPRTASGKVKKHLLQETAP